MLKSCLWPGSGDCLRGPGTGNQTVLCARKCLCSILTAPGYLPAGHGLSQITRLLCSMWLLCARVPPVGEARVRGSGWKQQRETQEQMSHSCLGRSSFHDGHKHPPHLSFSPVSGRDLGPVLGPSEDASHWDSPNTLGHWSPTITPTLWHRRGEGGRAG